MPTIRISFAIFINIFIVVSDSSVKFTFCLVIEFVHRKMIKRDKFCIICHQDVEIPIDFIYLGFTEYDVRIGRRVLQDVGLVDDEQNVLWLPNRHPVDSLNLWKHEKPRIKQQAFLSVILFLGMLKKMPLFLTLELLFVHIWVQGHFPSFWVKNHQFPTN